MRQKPMAAASVSPPQNLKDAGCGPELAEQFFALKEGISDGERVACMVQYVV